VTAGKRASGSIRRKKHRMPNDQAFIVIASTIALPAVVSTRLWGAAKQITMNSIADAEEKLVEAYARVGSDDQDIAAILEVPVPLLVEVFGNRIEHWRADRRASLLKSIWDTAKGGNANLLTWLGKVELGWAERAKRGKPRPPPPTDTSFNFEAFSAAFDGVHLGGVKADDATLRRMARMAIHAELGSLEKPPPIVESCITSDHSPGSSSKGPSSTTGGSPSPQRPNRPSS
jgi:hypothetical protein